MHYINKENLVDKGSVSFFEEQVLETIAENWNISSERVQKKYGKNPFGNIQDQWIEFTCKICPGDELWSYSTVNESAVGSWGYAIIRKGEITEIFETGMT